MFTLSKTINKEQEESSWKAASDSTPPKNVAYKLLSFITIRSNKKKFNSLFSNGRIKLK